MGLISFLKNLTNQKRQYAAAKNTLNTGGWQPVDNKINTILAGSLPQLRSRARQLVRDMPAMATALDRVTDFTVGTGIKMQARVIDPATGKLHSAVNQRIEDAWAWWCDEADDAGRLHFNEIQQLSCRGEVEVGDYVLIKKHSQAAGRYLPFSLQLLESDQLSGYGGTPLAGNDVFEGVEYDPRTGRAMAYHFDDAARFKQTIRIAADRVILGYRTLRPNQLRGVTPLAPVILLAHSLSDYLEATIDKAQKESRWLAFVTSPDPIATMGAFGAAASPTYTDPEGNPRYSMDMGHSVIDFLRTGETVTIPTASSPGDAFPAFVKFILQTFAAAVGVSYELISGNYYDAKYTAARISRNDMIKGIRPRRDRLVRQLCENVRREFLDWAVLTGKLNLPGYFTNQEHYRRVVWVDPGMEQLDPQRETRAEIEAVNARLRSPQEILLARGRDPEQVLDEIKQWQDMAESRGIILDGEQMPLKSNPAALEEQPVAKK